MNFRLHGATINAHEIAKALRRAKTGKQRGTIVKARKVLRIAVAKNT